MKDVLYFTAAEDKDPKFAAALRKARDEGVGILAFDCDVTEDGLYIADKVNIDLS